MNASLSRRADDFFARGEVVPLKLRNKGPLFCIIGCQCRQGGSTGLNKIAFVALRGALRLALAPPERRPWARPAAPSRARRSGGPVGAVVGGAVERRWRPRPGSVLGGPGYQLPLPRPIRPRSLPYLSLEHIRAALCGLTIRRVPTRGTLRAAKGPILLDRRFARFLGIARYHLAVVLRPLESEARHSRSSLPSDTFPVTYSPARYAAAQTRLRRTAPS